MTTILYWRACFLPVCMSLILSILLTILPQPGGRGQKFTFGVARLGELFAQRTGLPFFC